MNPLIINRQNEKAMYIWHIGDIDKPKSARMQMIITKSQTVNVGDLQMLDKAHVIVEKGILSTFKSWMAGERVQDAADALGISKARAGRIREGLSIQKYKKPGGSRSSLYRKTGSTIPKATDV